MKLAYEDLKMGDEIIALSTFSRVTVKNKKGIIIYKDNTVISVFFYENVFGHSGCNSKETIGYRKELAKKYNVPVDNCWNFGTVIYRAGKIIVADTKIDIKFDLYKLAKI